MSALRVAIVGAGMGGLTAAATLRRPAATSRVRAGQPLRAHRRRHPDAAQLDEGAARHRPRREAAQLRLRATLASQPRLGHRRDAQRAADARRALRRALSLHAPRRSPRGAAQRRAGRDDAARQEAHRPGAGRRRRDCWPSPTARAPKRDARDRRGRRALRRARAPARPGDAAFSRPRRLSRRLPRVADRGRDDCGIIDAPSGGDRTATSSSTTRRRTAARSTSSPACPSRSSG